MGLPDLYPFVISPVAAEKLGFVHELLARGVCSEGGLLTLFATKRHEGGLFSWNPSICAPFQIEGLCAAPRRRTQQV